MTNHEFFDFLHPTIADLLTENQADRAISVAKKTILAAENDWEIGPFRRAEECNKAYYQLSLTYALLNRKEEAAEAAKRAFEYDNFLFDETYYLIKILIDANNYEMDKMAAFIFNWFAATHLKFHGETEGLKKSLELLEANKNRCEEIKWELADYEYFQKLLQTDDSPEIYETLLDMIEGWRKEGRNDDSCDAIKINTLYYMDRESEMLEVWGDRPLSRIPYLFAFTRVCCQMIEEGMELSYPLPFPAQKSTNPWLLCTNEIYSSFQRIVHEDGLTDEILAKLEEQPDLKKKFFAKVKLARTCAEQGLALYEAFFNGEINGSCTAPFQYVQFLDAYGELLGRTGNRLEGMLQLQKGMAILPHKTLAGSIVSLALDMKDGVTALQALNWLKENALNSEEEEATSWERRHMHRRLVLWAQGLTCETFDQYLILLHEYYKEYKDLYRVIRCLHYETSSMIPAIFNEQRDEYIYASNNIHEMLCYFEAKEPENLDIVSMKILNRSIIPSRETLQWAENYIFKEGRLNLIEEAYKEDPSEHTQSRYCDALIGAAYLLIHRSIYDIYADEESDNKEIFNKETFKQSLQLLEKARDIVTTQAQKEQLLVNQAIAYQWNFEREEESQPELAYKAIDCYKELLDLIKDEIPNKLNPDCYTKGWVFHEMTLEELPTTLFNLCYGKYFLFLHKLNAPNEEQLAVIRKQYEYEPISCMTWYRIALKLREQALASSVGSEAFEECKHFTDRYLDLFNDEPEDPERGELIPIAIDLAVAENHLRYAENLLFNLTLFHPDSPELESSRKKVEHLREVFEQDKEAMSEAEERKIRSLKILEIEGIDLPYDLPVVETKKYAKKRDVAEIARVAIGTTIVSSLAIDITNDEFDLKTFEEGIEQIKQLDAYHFLSKQEEFILSRHADEDSINQMVWKLESARILFWALGLIDLPEIAEEEILLADLMNSLPKFDTIEHFIAQTNLRSIDEILDRLDLVYRCQSVCERYMLDKTPPEETFIHPYVNERWLAALNWLIDSSGINDWSSCYCSADPLSSTLDDTQKEELRKIFGSSDEEIF